MPNTLQGHPPYRLIAAGWLMLAGYLYAVLEGYAQLPGWIL